jgi:hypothetical protein
MGWVMLKLQQIVGAQEAGNKHAGRKLTERTAVRCKSLFIHITAITGKIIRLMIYFRKTFKQHVQNTKRKMNNHTSSLSNQ